MHATFSAAVMAGWQARGAKSDAAFGRRAGICHPCQHNGSEKGSPKLLPGKPQPPFFTAVELKELKTTFLLSFINKVSKVCFSIKVKKLNFFILNL